RCGRLKCCLRYEYDVYEELLGELPPVGAMIVTPQGKARVLAHEILARKLLVMMEDNRRIMISSNEVLTVMRPSHPPRPHAELDTDTSLDALVDYDR
ncbi:MAG TPA: hypothetical protein PKD72_15130, partial [Gemmatales bacterium]|nr:hypothetical protein [Gemmatales bacterium]